MDEEPSLLLPIHRLILDGTKLPNSVGRSGNSEVSRSKGEAYNFQGALSTVVVSIIPVIIIVEPFFVVDFFAALGGTVLELAGDPVVVSSQSKGWVVKYRLLCCCFMASIK